MKSIQQPPSRSGHRKSIRAETGFCPVGRHRDCQSLLVTLRMAPELTLIPDLECSLGESSWTFKLTSDLRSLIDEHFSQLEPIVGYWLPKLVSCRTYPKFQPRSQHTSLVSVTVYWLPKPCEFVALFRTKTHKRFKLDWIRQIKK